MEEEKGLGPEGISTAVDPSEEEEQQLDSLGSTLRAKFAEYKDARNDVEDD